MGQLPRWPTFPRRAQPCLAEGAGGAAAWVYLDLLLAVPGPRASRISSSQLSRKPGLSAATRDKNSLSCLLTELGKGLVPPLPLIIASLLAVPWALDQIQHPCPPRAWQLVHLPIGEGSLSPDEQRQSEVWPTMTRAVGPGAHDP